MKYELLIKSVDLCSLHINFVCSDNINIVTFFFSIDRDFLMVLVYLSVPGSTLRNCTRRELELYYNMPRDMIKVFPILALSSLPLGQNLAFPIG